MKVIITMTITVMALLLTLTADTTLLRFWCELEALMSTHVAYTISLP